MGTHLRGIHGVLPGIAEWVMPDVARVANSRKKTAKSLNALFFGRLSYRGGAILVNGCVMVQLGRGLSAR